jgi:UDP-glucose 4-epimerase
LTNVEIFITGATGFVGRHLARQAVQSGFKVTAMGRSRKRLIECFGNTSDIALVEYKVDSEQHLAFPQSIEKSVLVHLAGLTHSPNSSEHDLEAAIVEFSRDVFGAAYRSRISRIVNVSSIAARDQKQEKRAHIRLYGQAKEKVEAELTALSQGGNLNAISLRPPAVWGDDASGAAGALAAIVGRGIPLPFANLSTLRSYIHVNQLCSTILDCAEKLLPKQSCEHRIFEVGNSPQMLASLIRSIAEEKGKTARLFPFSQTTLRTALRIIGKGGLASQLYNDLRINDTPLRDYLNNAETDT